MDKWNRYYIARSTSRYLSSEALRKATAAGTRHLDRASFRPRFGDGRLFVVQPSRLRVFEALPFGCTLQAGCLHHNKFAGGTPAPQKSRPANIVRAGSRGRIAQ
jgi:hypothetical protein